MKNVIAKILPRLILLLVVAGPSAGAQPSLQRQVDSLFAIASSGSVRYRDMTGPAMDAIAAMGTDVVPLLVDRFETRLNRRKWTVLWILQRIGTEATPGLVAGLGRTEGEVLSRVCWALGYVGDTSAVMPLLKAARNDRWRVREEALGALGKIGDQRAAETILAGTEDTVGQVRKAAAVAAGRLALMGSEIRLVDLLGDEFYGARWAAAEALLKLDTSVVVQTLSAIPPEPPLAGFLACRVLARLGTDDALNLLYDWATSDDVQLRVHAAVAVIEADPDDRCGFHRELVGRENDRLARLKIESALSTYEDGR